ncbi:hypothetical protein ACN8ZM_39965 (plasmid) [Burkholderia aenigmatica]|uniref:hypothetical protein n=1 Tax=Burkholderia aenigmatica TaxID=2015348 RepID=UPI003B427F48
MDTEIFALVDAGPDKSPVASASVQQLVDLLGRDIVARLPVEPRQASLMPHRHCGAEALGLHWADGGGNHLCIHFHIGESFQMPGPENIELPLDFGVPDMTDALLIARFIVCAVNGNALIDL